MKEALADIVKYAGGFVVTLVIETDNGETKIEAKHDKDYILVRGKLKTALKDLPGRNGFGNLETLKLILDDPLNKADSAKVEVITRQKDSTTFVEEIRVGAGKNLDRYRLMSSDLVKVGKPYKAKDQQHEIDMPLTKDLVAMVSYFAQKYSQYEPFFRPKIVNGDFRLYITEENAASSGGFVTLAENVKGDITRPQLYSCSELISVLKLASENNGNFKMNFKGAILLEFSSDYVDWEFVLPGQIIAQQGV